MSNKLFMKITKAVCVQILEFKNLERKKDKNVYFPFETLQVVVYI